MTETLVGKSTKQVISEGRQAFRDNLPPASNPYIDVNQNAMLVWKAGWINEQFWQEIQAKLKGK